MNTAGFITELFCRIDDALSDVRKHSQATLYPSEVVTLACLFALKDGHGRAFYRWLTHNWRHLFPHLPHRTRLFRLFVSHAYLTERFMADPTILGVIDSYGIELIHPIREGRSAQQIGRKGLSHKRWIVGGKLCLLLNKFGLIVGWDFAAANVYDAVFQPLIEAVIDEMIGPGGLAFPLCPGRPSQSQDLPQGHLE